MAVAVKFPSQNRGLFTQTVVGFFDVPSSLSEDPLGSGLYIPSSALTENNGLYTIPSGLLGSSEEGISNLHSFSVQEDATPIDPSSTSGGVGTITVSMDEFPDAPFLMGEAVFTDGTRGKTSGIVREISGSDGILTVTADSALSLFNVEKTAMPYVGTLRGAIQYYCDLVGIQNDVVVSEDVANRSVIYPGWFGNAWVQVKAMLAAEQVEMALVFDRIYVRPLRMLEANLDRLSTRTFNVSSGSPSRTLEINYYNHVEGTQLEVYPVASADRDASIIVVDAGETQTLRVTLDASLSSVNQPTLLGFVENRSYDNTTGVYAVSGNDGLPVQPAQWVAQGGSLSVSLTEDPSVIEVTVTGAVNEDLAPFRIAMSSGSSNYYNALHITGRGVRHDKKSVTIPTGASAQTTSADSAVVVDNPFITSLSQAHSLGTKAAQSHAGLVYTISGNAYDLNRNGQGRELIQATIADFNSEVLPGTSIAQFNSEWVGNSISDFNAYWQSKVDTIWENQLFGNAPGARVLTPDANFRIVNATTNETSVQFTAELDTTIADFNTVWEGGTIEEFNSQFAGFSSRSYSTVPLRRDV